MKLIMLGSGTSAGVPRIGNDWGTCNSENPRNRRTRVSIIVESSAGKRILVDTSPDLRAQLLATNIADVDAVIWTHDHADHCHGIDDLRTVFHNHGGPIDGFARTYTLKNLKSRFAYIFKGNKGYPAMISAHSLKNEMPICGMEVGCTDQPHGPVFSTGLRFNCDGHSLVYATDFHAVTDDMLALYKGCDILVIDSLREDPHPTHAHLALSLELADKCKAKLTILTHMDKSMDYERLKAILPSNVIPGYDGLIMRLGA